MISKNQIKLIKSLHSKKYRIINQLFIAEGEKVIKELIDAGLFLHSLYVVEDVFDYVDSAKRFLISFDELKKISALTVPNNCLAVFEIPQSKSANCNGLILALDDIRDPGNFGTIIRLCDWYGIEQIWCSFETVDLYNPKVVQATMGSISRVNIAYLDLEDSIRNCKLPVIGTFMDGQNIYKTNLPKQGIIIMGNEANGISKKIENLVSQKIAIPRFGNLQITESLNVANATAIILSEFKRND